MSAFKSEHEQLNVLVDGLRDAALDMANPDDVLQDHLREVCAQRRLVMAAAVNELLGRGGTATTADKPAWKRQRDRDRAPEEKPAEVKQQAPAEVPTGEPAPPTKVKPRVLDQEVDKATFEERMARLRAVCEEAGVAIQTEGAEISEAEVGHTSVKFMYAEDFQKVLDAIIWRGQDKRAHAAGATGGEAPHAPVGATSEV